MKIYFIQAYGEYKKGKVLDLPRDEAYRIIRSGAAVPITHPLAKPSRSEPETASLEPKGETADMPRPKPKRGRPKKSE